MRKVIVAIAVVALTALIGGAGSLAFAFWNAKRDSNLARELKSRAQAINLHASRRVSEQKAPAIQFTTTRSTWGKICGHQDSLCGEPEGLAYSGPALFVIVPAVFLADAIVSVGTVPYDAIASPFRDRPISKVSTWEISGNLVDKENRPLPDIDLRIVYGFENAGSQKLGGIGKSRTDKAGAFQTTISATPENGWDNSFRVAPGHLKTIRCPSSQDVCS